MKIHFLLACFFLFKLISAADIQIVEIRDSNLFQLKNGTLVRLANVDAPSVDTPDSNLAYLARSVKKYAENKYRSYPVSVVYSGKKDSNGYPLVHIFQYYPLETVHINLVYLKKGFGRYVESAGDTTYQSIYKEAARLAKKEKRGVWNPTPYKKINLSDYMLSFLWGYRKPRDTFYKTSYNEITMRLAPAKEISGLEARGSVYFKTKEGRLCCECGGSEYIPPYRTETSVVYVVSGIFHRTFKWAGFSLGMTYLNTKDMYCSEGADSWVFPSATVKAGLMEKVYLSVSLWDYYRISEYTAGVTYIFKNPFTHFWIGFGSYVDYKNRAFQLDYNFYKNFLLHLQGGCLLKEKTEIYGRIGFGFILH